MQQPWLKWDMTATFKATQEQYKRTVYERKVNPVMVQKQETVCIQARCVLLTKPLTADLLISFLLAQNGYSSYRGKAKGPGHAIGKDEEESTILC